MAMKIDAAPMIRSITTNSKDKAAEIGKFFKAANTGNLQGPAVISYFTELNKVSANKRSLTKEAADRFDRLPDLIDKEARKNPDLKYEIDKFLFSLKLLYPKTLQNRVSLASQGAVTADKVEPKSRFKKFMVFVNRLISED